MSKLNNKGYLLIEIIVAIVLAMGIAYFLMNLTIKFSEKDEDVYQSISWTNDKNVLTNVIMDDIEKYTLVKIEDLDDEDGLIFTYFDFINSEQIEKELIVDKDGHVLSYGDDYSKKIDKSLQIGSIELVVEEQYTIIVVPMTSVYYDEDYGIKLFIPYFVEIDSDAIVFDLSGNYNNGIIKDAEWNRSEGVLVTNGTSSYVKAGFANYNLGDSVTFMTRLKFNSLTNPQYIIGNWESGGGGIFKDASNKLVFELHIGGYKQAKTDFTVSSGEWYTVVGVYDGANVKLYVNGSSSNITTTAISDNVTVSSAPIVLGANPNSSGIASGGYANVTFDNAVVFDRVLTDDEISSYHSNGMSGIDRTDLLFYYDF